MTNVGDRKSIRAAEKAAAIAAAERVAVTREIMSTTFGRAWMWDLLAQCHVFASTFTPSPLTTAFAEGERNIGLRLMADILMHCPDQYIQAQQEANERSSIADARAAAIGQRSSSSVDDGRDSGSVASDAYEGGSGSGFADGTYEDDSRFVSYAE